MQLSAVLLLALAFSAVATRKKIVPELEPESDEKFMKKDLPDDRRPRVFHKFDHPYPIVQDSEEYDADYVEDKNDDGGYWSAQMKYDALKNKLTHAVDELKASMRDMQGKKKVLDAAVKRENDAEKASELAEANEKEADGHHDEAAKDLKDAKSGVDSGADKVDDETMDLEECKKQLAEAREKLKKLLDEKKARENNIAELEKAEADAEAAEVGAERDEEKAEKTVAEEEKDVEAAKIKYKKELEDVKVAEQNLDKQSETLRKFRHADPDGGVYEVKGFQGGSQSARPFSFTLMAVAIAATFYLA